MTKKEISEIKKQFTPANCAITRIAGCYINQEKEQVGKFKEAFLSLPEEELFKYFDLFRKSLSGKLGKNLLNMEWPPKEEDSRHQLLMKLKQERLTNDQTLEQFYQAITEHYECGENYMILIVHGAYDVPGASNKENVNEEEQWSDEVYEHILCLICPVNLDKPSLVLEENHTNLRCKNRDWVVEMPTHAFLFPAFDNRRENVHGLLYYTKKSECLQESFLDVMFGVEYLRPLSEQKDAMKEALEATGIEFEQMKELKEKTWETLNDTEESILNAAEVEKLCASCGIQADGLKDILQAQSCQKLSMENVIDTKKTEISTGEATIKIDNDYLHCVKFMEIEGRKCIVLETNTSILMDGVPIQHTHKEEEQGHV